MSESKSAETQPAKQPLPPGMILGPDGKPCKICTAFRNWPKTTKKTTQNASSGSSTGTKTSAAVTTALISASQAAAPSHPPARSENCPPDVEQLGRATWTFLHTTAAYYPEKPTPNQRANMLTLIRSLPVLYPCTHCASDFGEEVKKSPPDVSGRVGLSRWLCERHNEVNEKLGKSKFNCAVEKLDERWKDGPDDGSCD
ncbi:hypothetical protein PHLCEN_2v8534 [Hermanssonia centrifuga]|uniref:Sulfhydryl oxidase n=1 Tax=Hermanssonia centrifuga TaxID=98765 RepID=A0A2R6NTB1_9APHY|nr:hypothetical protein PHLCEN_2v8534 [Hermanssonia centrifuga]